MSQTAATKQLPRWLCYASGGASRCALAPFVWVVVLVLMVVLVDIDWKWTNATYLSGEVMLKDIPHHHWSRGNGLKQLPRVTGGQGLAQPEIYPIRSDPIYSCT